MTEREDMTIENVVPSSQPIDAQALGDLMDGKGEPAGALAASDHLAWRLLDELRFQMEVMAEIHALTDPASRTPLQDRGMIRIKAAVAVQSATKSGLLA